MLPIQCSYSSSFNLHLACSSLAAAFCSVTFDWYCLSLLLGCTYIHTYVITSVHSLQLCVYSPVYSHPINTLCCTLHPWTCFFTFPSSPSTLPTHPTDSTVPPSADAGPDVHIFLPQHVVCMNGSGSHDDFGIVRYEWTRSENSPAAGVSCHGNKYPK